MTPLAPDRPAALAAWAGRKLGRAARLTPLAGDGGGRLYYRVAGEDLLALYGPDPAENRAWFHIGRHLYSKGLALPRLDEADLEAGFFLLEDLGDQLLADPGGPGQLDYYPQAVELLVRFHQEALEGFDPGWCHQTRRYDAEMVRTQEVGYFLKSLLVNYLGWPEPSPRVWAEAARLAEAVATADENPVLIHRDYQARNLMIKDRRVYFIDWQGARLGPAAYDLASLLNETPYHPLSETAQEGLIESYLKARWPRRTPASFRSSLSLVGAARLMQALGAYGKIALSGKNKFVAFMAPAARLLARHFRRPPLSAAFPLLREATEETARQLASNSQSGRA